MRCHDNAQAGQMRENLAFEQGDEGSRIHGTAREQSPDEPIRDHLFGERLRSHWMNEHRNAEPSGNFKRRTRLRGIDQEIAARTLDEQTAKYSSRMARSASRAALSPS